QVWPVGGPAVPPGSDIEIWDPSSPLRSIRAEASSAHVTFYGGSNPSIAQKYARSASVAIVFAYQWLSEGGDAASLSLPDHQDELIATVSRANPNTIVVLETGDPVTMPWLAQTPAVMEVWYPGQKGATAIARLLFGDLSPSGHLPITFPASVAQLPRWSIDARHADYNIEGSDAGYRWFETRNEKPLFPFGYGLSYSTFRYSNLRVRAGNPVTASFDVTNTGMREAADVPQLYVSLPPAGGERARRLAGWQRVDLHPGESRTLSVRVDSRILARFDARAGDWHIFPGSYTFALGSSSADLFFQQTIMLRDFRLHP
ncbi:MAG TPA: glycoside hydrolase family 3 C-terminal domain-containing protein, partial [Candidatus Baltobacteraceae bacterium]|nr:glycoside hydrolase family 3 C-terminal domain-containing protein [Candidatus Baltobacteraceae bacterium]